MTGIQNTLIPSTRHEIWGWPVAANFFLGGTACGFFLLSLINTDIFLQAKTALPLFRYNIVSPFLVAAGFLIVGIEAGSPLRGKFLLHHLKRSWMSREVLAGMLFIIFALSDWVYPHAMLKIIAAVTAAVLMLCQAMMVYRAKAVIAWTKCLIPCYFVLSAMVNGFGLYLLWSVAVSHMTVSTLTLLLGLCGLFANLVIWYVIVKPKNSGYEDRAIVHLRDPLSMTMTFGFGHVVPILLVSSILIFTFADFTRSVILPLLLITGICILAGGIVQKLAFILQTNALCEVTSGNPQHQVPNCPR